MDNSYYKTNAFRIPFIHSNWFLNRRVKSRYKRYQDRRSNNELTNLAHEDLLKMDMLKVRCTIALLSACWADAEIRTLSVCDYGRVVSHWQGKSVEYSIVGL